MALNTPLPFLVLLLFSCSLSSTFAFSIEEPISSIDVGKKQREFDYFKLALQWPGTCCQRTSHCCPSNGCCLKSGPLTEFTIHGLWPDYDDGTWPACCKNDEFDLKKVSSLLGALQKYWPSLSCSSPSLCQGGKGLFWAHEWGKHGTCSSPVIKDEYSYFSTALDLYFKYNITRIIYDAGFQASMSASYDLEDVIHAIEVAVGATPQVICSQGYVEELRLCFYKDLKPRDCVLGATRNDFSKSSCPKRISLPIYRPVSDKQGLGIKLWPIDDVSQAFPKIWVV